ncbi:hypothetical protein EU805_14555 [Salipiger sp. IMCC34102]|uniref:GumC family protein n=1 Tax=Salipiger sp. IMCC34102 TaxID=2510647 RepID=UPI00101D6B22|nr:Wzz/FepE/Etk N-terminal domain-containing protein [Salipiger sp. IMCC34102]RYH01220.1 hypothetical protein EU805_14555 [Salipiger sp. IMCC34102]
MDQISIIRDLFRMVMRRFFLFCLIAGLGSLGAVWYALSLSQVFEAAAVVQIQRPQIATDRGDPGTMQTTAQRIQQIEQQLSSRDNLLEVANKYGLFEAADITTAERIHLMRLAFRLESVPGMRLPNGLAGEPSALIITTRLAEAEQSALVANEFVSRLMERNLRDRETRTAETLAFFRREEERLAQQIADLDTQLLEFKYANANSLPEGLEFKRDEIVRLDEDAREISRQLLALDRQVAILEQGDIGPLGDTGAPDPVSLEISRLKIDLSRLLATAPGHFNIPRLRNEIAALEENETALSQQRTDSQRVLIEDEVALLNEQIASIADRRARLDEQIQTTPGVEQELAAFARRREQLQQQLDAAIQGRAEAEVEQRLEANRQAERFEVLESALVPDHPVEPSRKKIVLAGSIASIALAFGVIFLLELANPVIRSTSRFQRALGTVPTIALPHVATIWETRRRRLGRGVALLFVIVGIPASLMLIDQKVLSFEEMAEVVDTWDLPIF